MNTYSGQKKKKKEKDVVYKIFNAQVQAQANINISRKIIKNFGSNFQVHMTNI